MKVKTDKTDKIDSENTSIDKKIFLKKLHFVGELCKASKKLLSKEEIIQYFKGMGLCDEQWDLIYHYLENILNNEQENDSKSQKIDSVEQIELPHSLFFKMYLKDLEEIKQCSPKEEEMLFEQLIAGNEIAMHQLSEQWFLKVFDIAKNYVTDPEEMADAIQEGNIGVFLALKSMLGSNRKKDFHKELTKAAEKAINDYLSNAVAIEDMDQSLLAKATLVYESQKYLANEFQRVPTTAELSQYTKMSEEELKDILAMSEKK